MKKTLRKIALEKRAGIDSGDAPMRLAQNFMKNVSLPKKATIALYMPVKSEIDVNFLAAVLADAGHNLCLPRIDGAQMNFHAYQIGDELQKNGYGIFEPLIDTEIVQPDVMLVPMLGFDAKKNRLGYGGGYYDKFLQNSKVLKIGIAYAQQEIEQIPTGLHDIKMDKIVTEDFVL